MTSIREQVLNAQGKRKYAETVMVECMENMKPLEEKIVKNVILLKHNYSCLSEETSKLTDLNEKFSILSNSKSLEFDKIQAAQLMLNSLDDRMKEMSDVITDSKDEIRQFNEGIELVLNINESTKNLFEDAKCLLLENSKISRSQSKLIDDKFK
jgi:sugar-specific transcriptional regulator TrmB